MFNYSHIKHRNMFLQLFLVVITLGLYGIYWFHVTLGELHRANNRDPETGSWKWTIYFCIPILNFLSLWHYVGEYAEFVWNKHPKALVFILGIPWILFPPFVWFLAQLNLNRAARYHW